MTVESLLCECHFGRSCLIPPVFAAEYTDTGVDFDAACAWGKQHAFSFILKNRDLGAFLETCP